MKKIIILVVLILNVNLNFKEFKLNFIFGYCANAQCVPNYAYNIYLYQIQGGGPPVSGAISPATSGGTNPGWWTSFTTWLSSVGSNIGQLFGGQASPAFLPANQWSSFGTSIYPPGYFSQFELTGGGTSSGTSGILDCFNVDGGTAKRDVCGVCVGGTTGADSCNKPNTSDTLKPVKIPCLPDAVARDLKSDTIMNHIKDSAVVKDARDNAKRRKFETGLTITRLSTPTPGVFRYRPRNYDTTGVGQTVSITNLQGSIANLHIHPFEDSAGTKLDQSPSPLDYYGLLQNYSDTNNFFYYKFERRFVIAGNDNLDEFAAVISDSSKAITFFTNNPIDSVIETNPLSPRAYNWKGSDSTGFYKRFFDAYNNFKKEGYPKSMLETYANVYMLNTRKIGIVLQQKIDGKFKELSFVEETDPLTNVKHYRIKICD